MSYSGYSLRTILFVVCAHIIAYPSVSYAQILDRETKLLVKIVSHASQLAGAASACEDLETGGKATHIRDSAIAAGFDHGIIDMDEKKLLKSLSSNIFSDVRAKFQEKPPFPCSRLDKALSQLENLFKQK